MIYKKELALKCSTLFYVFLFVFLGVNSYLTDDHYAPWPTYDSQIYAFFALNLYLIFYILKYKENIKINSHSIFFVFIFIYSLCQINLYSYYQDYLLFNLYLLNCLILVLFSMSSVQKEENTSYLMMTFFLACLGSVIVFFKDNSTFAIDKYDNFLCYRYLADMAQPNHLATLFNIGILSCLYFFNKNKIVFYVFILVFIVFVILTQSRMGWLSIFIIIFVSCFKYKYLSRIKLFLIISLWPFIIILSYIFNKIQNCGSSLLNRIYEPNLRLIIWRDFINIFDSFYGYGYKGLVKNQFVLGHSKEYITSYHNFLFDIMVIFGGIGILIFIYIVFQLIKFFILIDNEQDLFKFGVILIIFFHSLLEYPLFYSYFLFPFLYLFACLLTKYSLNGSFILFNRNIFLLFILILVGFNYIYYSNFNYFRTDYRSAYRGKCIDIKENKIIFDRFSEMGYLNCKANINLLNLHRYERLYFRHPSPNNIKKLIYIYNYLGKYKERDELLMIYNNKYNKNITIDQIKGMIYFFK